MKKEWKHIAFLTGIFVLLIVVEVSRPEPIDWRPTYSRNDKIPFGTYVLADLIPDMFKTSHVSFTDKTVYETLEENPTAGSYLFITETFSPDALDTENLLHFAEMGGTVLIAAENFSGPLADSLRLKTRDYLFHVIEKGDTSKFSLYMDSLTLNFVNPSLKAKKDYGYKRGSIAYYFSSFDSTSTTILGLNNKEKPTLIRISYGSGDILVSSNPIAFTNYSVLLANNNQYAAGVLSYLPEGNVFWDEYYKTGKMEDQRTPLRFILSKSSLAWAYGITFISLIFYIAFEAKRRQRIIPVIAPLQNATLEFVDTVGRLYYQHGDHKNLADKKITYFLESIRSRFYLKTNVLDEEFAEKLAEKSAVDKDQVKMLVSMIRKVHESDDVSEQTLIRLSEMIDAFNRQN